MPSETYKKFHDAVMNIQGTDKAEDLCFTVIDNPDFHALAKTSPQEAGQILSLAFNTLNQEEAFQAGMAIIDTPGALALPESTLVDVLAAAKERMTPEDQSIFANYLGQTRTGKSVLALS